VYRISKANRLCPCPVRTEACSRG